MPNHVTATVDAQNQAENIEQQQNGLHKSDILTEKENLAVLGLLELIHSGEKNSTIDKATQVKSGDILTSFVNYIDSDAKLNSLTGLASFDLLETIIDIYKDHFPLSRVSKLCIKERIIMTFLKLKTALKFVVIATLFSKISSQTCKRIFNDTISKLAVILKPIISWPTLEECQKNLPKCFKIFSNVRVVFDCTELQVQKSNCLCCRIKTYSHYKGCQTIKFMTGVTPAGLISFISRAYGGKASDKTIFEQSNIINKLEMGRDAVMVDKGFRIEDITASHFIKLIQPPFAKKGHRFTEAEVSRNVQIAKARVHIERTNQRIKVFEILSKQLPWTLVPKILKISSR